MGIEYNFIKKIVASLSKKDLNFADVIRTTAEQETENLKNWD